MPGATVDQVLHGELHIRFDDGDRGWVQRDQVLPLEIRPGLRVLGRWKMASCYYPGVITEVRGDTVHIAYDDGDREWTTVAALRIPVYPSGPNARPTHIAARSNFGATLLGWLVPVGIVLALIFLWR
jgi:hypothetical protein